MTFPALKLTDIFQCSITLVCGLRGDRERPQSTASPIGPAIPFHIPSFDLYHGRKASKPQKIVRLRGPVATGECSARNIPVLVDAYQARSVIRESCPHPCILTVRTHTSKAVGLKGSAADRQKVDGEVMFRKAITASAAALLIAGRRSPHLPTPPRPWCRTTSPAEIDPTGPWTLKPDHKTLTFGGRWSLGAEAGHGAAAGRDMAWKDVNAGAYVKLTPNIRVGGLGRPRGSPRPAAEGDAAGYRPRAAFRPPSRSDAGAQRLDYREAADAGSAQPSG
jgi:hypothetical protein